MRCFLPSNGKIIGNVLVKNRLRTSKQNVIVYHFINGLPVFVSSRKERSVVRRDKKGCVGDYREPKIETFSGRRQLQPDVTSSFVEYCACSCSPPCRRGPVGDVKLGCLALWRKREYLTFISIRFVAFSNQHFADYRS